MHRLKKRIILLIIVLVACGLVYLPLAAGTLARFYLQKALPGSRVSVGRCSWRFPGQLLIKDIVINSPGSYEIAIPETAVSPGLGPRIDILGARLEASSSILVAEATVSAVYLPLKKEVQQVDLSLERLRYAELEIRDFSLRASQGEPGGRFSARSLIYNRIQVDQIEGDVFLRQNGIDGENVRAQLMGGEVNGVFQLAWEGEVTYQGSWEVTDIDFSRLIDALGLQEKIRATGELSGSIALGGLGSTLSTVDGQLITGGPHGTFVITDESFLKGLAQTGKQDFQALMDAFKDYAYTRGTVTLSAVQDSLVFSVYLDGENGKREMAINVHNFFYYKNKRRC